MDEIVFLFEKNDIIAIKIKANEEIMEIGSSSNCKAGSNKFFDKKFYIENIEFDNLETFIEKIKIYIQNGYLNVISIDGIKVKE